MKNPIFWLLVLFLLHALVPRNSSANPIGQAEISSITESEGNSTSPTEHTVIFQVRQKIMSVLSGDYSYITESDATEIKEAVLQSVLSGNMLSPAENDAIIQYEQRMEAIELGNFSSLTQNDAEKAMEIVMQTFLAGNFSFSSPTENELMEIMQEVLSGNYSSRTENNVTFDFQQKIQAIMTSNFSNLTDDDEAEVLAAVLKSVLSAEISNSTENNALFSAQQKVQSIMLGDFSSLIENNVTKVIEAVVEEMLLPDPKKLTEKEKEEFMKQTNVLPKSLSPTVNGFLDGTNMMIDLIDNLKGKVKDSKFDQIVIDMENHLKSLDKSLAKNREKIIELLYKGRDKIVKTKNMLMIAAFKLKKHCLELIKLYERNETDLRFIKYTTRKFVKYATFVKGILEDAEVELDLTQQILSDVKAKIYELRSVLTVEEKKLWKNYDRDLRNIEREQKKLAKDLKELKEKEEKRRGDSNIARWVLYPITWGVAAIVVEPSIAIANAVEGSKERKRAEALKEKERDIDDMRSNVSDLEGTAKGIRNVNEAAGGVEKVVDEMKKFVAKEILLIINWKLTIEETLEEDWNDEDFLLYEGEEKITQSLTALIGVCDKYIGNKLPDFLRTK